MPSQWETAWLCNDVSHWLDANLESALGIIGLAPKHFMNHEYMCSWQSNWPTKNIKYVKNKSKLRHLIAWKCTWKHCLSWDCCALISEIQYFTLISLSTGDPICSSVHAVFALTACEIGDRKTWTLDVELTCPNPDTLKYKPLYNVSAYVLTQSQKQRSFCVCAQPM